LRLVFSRSLRSPRARQPGGVDLPGVWRATIDPAQGFVSPSARLVPSANLAGNQPTSIALGPDGNNPYVGFLKNGSVIRIVNPTLDPSSKSQIVQSVGTSHNGRPVRSLAFVGPDLYLAYMGGLSVIKNAVASTCLGCCNGAVVRGNSNLLILDRLGNLWIGDDPRMAGRTSADTSGTSQREV
jgi:hypothetical protein